MNEDIVAEGRAAWSRIRESGRRSWDDWMAVARALAQGRSEALQAAKANRPFGSRYNAAMGAWLRDCGLDGIEGQLRYRALLCLENLPAIEAWRATLSEKERDRLNHPGAIWTHFRRSIAEPAMPRRQAVAGARDGGKGGGRPIYWNGEAIRRAAMAIRETYSTDFFTMARRALEAAIRSEDDLAALLAERPPPRRGNGATSNHVAA
jgi:hypothetical protein